MIQLAWMIEQYDRDAVGVWYDEAVNRRTFLIERVKREAGLLPRGDRI